MSYAETILSGGRIWRGLHEGFAEALAIAGGRIVACGRRDAVEGLAGRTTRRIDLEGRLAIPAFNDSHQHLLPLGLSMGQVNLRAEEVRTLDELVEILTLAQTQKLAKKIIVIVYGKEYWSRVLNLEALADAGAISPADTQLFSFCDSPEEAFECLKEGLTKYHLQPPPARPVPEEGPEIAKTLP